MTGTRLVLKRNGKDEPEKPFWISFSDLMTALMVLFLVAMSVALLAVTKTVTETERARAEREAALDALLDEVEKAAHQFPGVSVDRNRNVIDFGERALFDTRSHQLKSNQAILLRQFVPKVLEIARSQLGRQWLKRIVVEGFTDQRGTYLFNLNLSLQRSQRVLCVLLNSSSAGEGELSPEDQEQIRELFLVGGYSFNSAKASLEESRRIEFRLEFFGIGETPLLKVDIPRGNFGTCSMGS
ncbi:OmpA/MotB family protein [Nitrospira moscoviensis]|uniref:OmpA/MotB domain protein n=1 Tax=Nitrospira moscoviensis TaxID=42253 RepID=A0A0K2GFK3_NITMO|nr:flagellar motor protein MotB [Nitrospira moscoviensis]ALA59738.1 OmpA/MotB domain protein [Nitrospira moscoviensis]